MTAQITISGYYGFRNAGDEALLSAMISDLRREAPGTRLAVLSRDPAETARTHGVEAVNRLDPLGVTRAMVRSGLFISGGGTLLQDKTSFRSLLYYAGLAWTARRLGCRLMLYANGLGPLETRAGRSLARNVIRSAHAITLRDNLSLEKMVSLFGGQLPPWLEDRVTVTADPALNLGSSDEDRVSELMRAEDLDGLGPMIMVSLRPWPGGRGLPRELAAALTDIYRDYGLCPVFLPFQHSMDLDMSRATLDLLGGDVPARLVTGTCSPRDIIGLIGRSRAVVGMRLHALILAVAAGVPAAGLVYDPKVTGFLDQLDLPAVGNVDSVARRELRQTLAGFCSRLDHHASTITKRRPGLAALAAENARIAAGLLG